MNLIDIFNQLNAPHAHPAISIFIPTHRTFPDNQQDAIALKNAIKELENRLTNDVTLDKAEAQSIMQRIEQSVQEHDHNYNLDTLAIFATPEQVEKVKFPFQVKPRIIIDQSFATRDILREINHAVHYYIVVISRTNARLLEVFNDQLLHEFDHDDELQGLKFPIENMHFYTTNAADRANVTKEDNYLKEFLNRVDKSVQEVYNSNPLPIIVVGDERNVGFYQQVSDHPAAIINTVTNSPNLEAEARLIIENVQEAITEYRNQQQQSIQDEINQARNRNVLLEDLSSIYRAAHEGRIQQVFVRKGYIQPAVVDEDTLHVDIDEKDSSLHTTDDVVDDILSTVIRHGGKTHFVVPAYLPENVDILADTRY